MKLRGPRGAPHPETTFLRPEHRPDADDSQHLFQTSTPVLCRRHPNPSERGSWCPQRRCLPPCRSPGPRPTRAPARALTRSSVCSGFKRCWGSKGPARAPPTPVPRRLGDRKGLCQRCWQARFSVALLPRCHKAGRPCHPCSPRNPGLKPNLCPGPVSCIFHRLPARRAWGTPAACVARPCLAGEDRGHLPLGSRGERPTRFWEKLCQGAALAVPCLGPLPLPGPWLLATAPLRHFPGKGATNRAGTGK